MQVLAEAGGGLGWRSGVRRAPPPPTRGQPNPGGSAARAWEPGSCSQGAALPNVHEARRSAAPSLRRPKRLVLRLWMELASPTLVLVTPAHCEVLKLARALLSPRRRRAHLASPVPGRPCRRGDTRPLARVPLVSLGTPSLLGQAGLASNTRAHRLSQVPNGHRSRA